MFHGLKILVTQKMIPGTNAEDHLFCDKLDDGYARRLGALGTLADFELNALVLVEGLEATGLDLGVVNEDIAIGVVRGDEAEALFSVEPLDGSLCHLFLLIVELFKNGTPRAGLGHSARRILDCLSGKGTGAAGASRSQHVLRA
jgi:hypothetical protein